MKLCTLCLPVFASLLLSFNSFSQNSLKSLLINHGAPTCNSTIGEQEFFKGTTTGAPSMLAAFSNGINYFSAFTAYNPKDQKVYFADISAGNTTRMYAMDYNFSGILTNMLKVAPDYVYNYRIDQLCFDANGKNIAIYNYNKNQGTARVKRIELTTGGDIAGSDKVLNFPAGDQPDGLSWGDIVFMPNGRVFMVFGQKPSKLYELVDFDASSPNPATAIYLKDIPKTCFSIGYVDGNLIIAGSDNKTGCYYYIWDIDEKKLRTEMPLPFGKSTADMTHMNAGVGVSEELIAGIAVDNTTADLVYKVVVKNKGNINLYNVQAANNLARTYGFGNVSNVSASFVSNPAGLTLNPSYDGVTDTILFAGSSMIPNYPVAADSVVLQIRARVSNVIRNRFYYNSTTSTGQLGMGLNRMDVSDSSNNGDASLIDVNQNGVSDDASEGIPTPFIMTALLAENTLGLTAAVIGTSAKLSWHIANESAINSYVIERSADGVRFSSLASTMVITGNLGNYTFTDDKITANEKTVYYRIRGNEQSGKYVYSATKAVSFVSLEQTAGIYPNPAVSQAIVTIPGANELVRVHILDNAGRVVKEFPAIAATRGQLALTHINDLKPGMYLVKVQKGNTVFILKMIKR